VLDGFPNWSTDDLGKSLGGNPYGGEFPGSGDDSKPLGYYAAWAFAKTGRRQLAVQVVERLLWQDYDDPAAFTLLNQVAGGDALGFYDALIADNPLTTAPLTWKADLLRSQGRLKEAERCARAAVALDPGEVRQSGRTFKTYEVLGALLKAEGDAKGAQACLRKVGAARIAERASKFAKFGLLPQAIEAYRQSLKTSPDCYTEALLASCLGRCGKTAEALRHEAQAFRLLPESVGPASDLTFVQEALWNRDCEAIARAAFDRPSPSTAAACYLKAVVEDAAGQPRAAVRDLRKAVALNPRFGLALKDLADLGDRGFLTQAQTEEVQLQLIALGARQNAIDSFDLNDFDDMRSAYGALERMIAKLPPRPQGPLYPLHKAAQSRSFAMDEMDVDAGLMERQRLGNLVGGYFAGASDIQEILSYASMVSSMQR
jgi:tetratricopeptide (TPR) repeat protein